MSIFNNQSGRQYFGVFGIQRQGEVVCNIGKVKIYKPGNQKIVKLNRICKHKSNMLLHGNVVIL